MLFEVVRARPNLVLLRAVLRRALVCLVCTAGRGDFVYTLDVPVAVVFGSEPYFPGASLYETHVRLLILEIVFPV